MSYCRFAWDGSDVYIYAGDNGINCCGCRFTIEKEGPQAWFVCQKPEEMIAHLIEHKKAGHFVPFYAIERLWQEIDGPNIPVNPEPETLTKAKERI